MEKARKFWLWLVSKFFPRYELTVSYNQTWGDPDDRSFTVKKFYKRKEKY